MSLSNSVHYQTLNAFSRNHVFKIAVVQNSHTNNPIDLKFYMHV